MLLIKNGTILDPFTKLDKKLDILIDDNGIIEEISENIEKDCEIFDATNLYISPALIDVHVHFRTPGFEYKETVESGTSSALAGGYGTVICMANTKPIIDDEASLKNILEINKKSKINVLQSASITKGFNGQDLTDFNTLKKLGAVGFTDDGVYIKSANTSFLAMQLAKTENVVLSFHEEDNDLIFQAGANYGSKFCEITPTFVSEDIEQNPEEIETIKGARPESENVAVARDVSLAITTKARCNFQHLSTKESVELIRFGKSQGADIFAEVTPHHISLTEDALLEHQGYAKMNPPLRKEEDRIALINGLKDGTIDMIATDHAPHADYEKNGAFTSAFSGIIGLETAFSVSLTYLLEHMSIMEILEKFTVNPCKLYNITGKSIEKGNRAEVFVFNPRASVIYDDFYSKSSNTPYTGMALKGKVRATIMGDEILYRG